MTMHTTPSSIDFRGDASLGSILDALEPHSDKALEYAGRTIRPGYHVTEVKAGSFVTIDCGGNPDRWNESILQVEDLAPDGERNFMPVSKFRSILGQVAPRIELDSDARRLFASHGIEPRSRLNHPKRNAAHSLLRRRVLCR
jgi:hypothetical protein